MVWNQIVWFVIWNQFLWNIEMIFYIKSLQANDFDFDFKTIETWFHPTLQVAYMYVITKSNITRPNSAF